MDRESSDATKSFSKDVFSILVSEAQIYSVNGWTARSKRTGSIRPIFSTGGGGD